MIPLVLCFFAPFAFDQFTLPKIALAAVLVLAAGWREGFDKKHLTWGLLLLFTVLCVSAGLSSDPLVNITGRYTARYLGLIPLAVCLLAYHLAVQGDVPRQMRLAAAILSVHALSQLVWNPLPYEVLFAGRVSGAMGSPPTLGCVLAMCLPFCYGRTPARAALTALTMAAMLATGSRGPLLASVVAAAIIGWPDRQDRLGARLAAVLMAFAGVLVLFNHGKSDQIRLMTWATSLKIWWAHPFFGCGPESYTDAWRAFRSNEWVALTGMSNFQDHAHNDFLELLAAGGLFGLGAYCLLLRRAWRQLQNPWILERRAILASLAALFVCAKFNAVPFPALFAAAIILGSLDTAFLPNETNLHRRKLRLAAGVLAAWSVWATAADVVFYHARKVLDFPGIMRAVAMNPLELAYRAHEADLLTRKWDADGQKDPELLYNALDISWRTLHLHPGNVQARHMVTQNLVLLARTNPRFIAPAQKSAATLLALDPQLNFKFRVVIK